MDKKNHLIFNKNFIYLGILLIIILILYYPVRNASFSLIDDAMSIIVSRKIFSSISTLNYKNLLSILYEGGRFRALYWIMQFVSYLFANINAGYHFLFHFIVISITALGIYLTINTISDSKLFSFFGSVLYILNPINGENIYRLGPIEPFMSMILVYFIYFYFIKKYKISIALLFLLIYIKETAFVILLPILITYIYSIYFKKKNDKNILVVILFGIFFSLPVLIISLLNMRVGYASNYIVTFEHLKSTFIEYIKILLKYFSPYLIISIGTFIVSLYKNKEKYSKHILYSLFLFVMSFGYLMVQLPWRWVIERYMMPLTVGLIIFMALQLSLISSYLYKKYRYFYKMYILYIIFSISIFIFYNTYRTFQNGQKTYAGTNFIKNYTDLINNFPYKSQVCLNFIEGDQAMEAFYETQWHLNMFYNRYDINFVYLDLKNKQQLKNCYIVSTPSITPKYEIEEIDRALDKHGYQKHKITRKSEFIVLTTPTNIIKQTMKKLFKYLTKKQPFNGEGIYTYYQEEGTLYYYEHEK